MEDDSRTLSTINNQKTRSSTNNNHRCGGRGGDEYEDCDEECDLEAWQMLSKSFRDAQSVLDQNRALIQQVNENHQSKLHGNMVKNVGLIRQINGNISKVMGIYSHLNVSFTNIVHQRRGLSGKSNSGSDAGNHKDSCES